MPTFFEDMNEEMDDEGGGGGGGGSGRGGKKKVATGESNDYWMNENVVFQTEIYLISKKSIETNTQTQTTQHCENTINKQIN